MSKIWTRASQEDEESSGWLVTFVKIVNSGKFISVKRLFWKMETPFIKQNNLITVQGVSRERKDKAFRIPQSNN